MRINHDMLQILQARSPDAVGAARRLFREYEQWLGLSLCFQGFEVELEGLPGKYAEPDGRLFLATIDGSLAGCGAFRKLEDGICEMKRVFIKEDFRGFGVGKHLIERLIGDARSEGYSKMRLDTHPPKMGKAVTIYRSHGFREIPPYYDNPHDGVLFMELDL